MGAWEQGCPNCGETQQLIEQQLCRVDANYRVMPDSELEYEGSEFGDDPVVAVIGHHCNACGHYELRGILEALKEVGI